MQFNTFSYNTFNTYNTAGKLKSNCPFPLLPPVLICSHSSHFFPLQLSLKEGRKKKSIQDPRFDYYNMDRDDEDDIDLTEDELAHIVEIYDFPAEFKTEDLLKLFQCYQYVEFNVPLLALLVLAAF